MNFSKLIVAMIVGILTGALATSLGYTLTDFVYWMISLPPIITTVFCLNID